jgi:hypothetical protein
MVSAIFGGQYVWSPTAVTQTHSAVEFGLYSPQLNFVSVSTSYRIGRLATGW